jgi:hypothetical protein
MAEKRRTEAQQAAAWNTLLRLKPVKNAAADEKESQEGVGVTVENRIPWYLRGPGRLIFRVPSKKTTMLDSIGEQLWDWCDGENDVERIVDKFAGKYELTFHESRIMVSTYLQQLVKRGMLAMVKR